MTIFAQIFEKGVGSKAINPEYVAASTLLGERALAEVLRVTKGLAGGAKHAEGAAQTLDDGVAGLIGSLDDLGIRASSPANVVIKRIGDNRLEHAGSTFHFLQRPNQPFDRFASAFDGSSAPQPMSEFAREFSNSLRHDSRVVLRHTYAADATMPLETVAGPRMTVGGDALRVLMKDSSPAEITRILGDRNGNAIAASLSVHNPGHAKSFHFHRPPDLSGFSATRREFQPHFVKSQEQLTTLRFSNEGASKAAVYDLSALRQAALKYKV